MTNLVSTIDLHNSAIQNMTFADARAMILATIVDVRSGAIPVNLAMATFAGFKVLHDDIQTELNVDKHRRRTSLGDADFPRGNGGLLR